jgi:DNA-binding NarL/FixJ family response regulator
MSSASAIRIVTVDAQAIFRAGVRQICSAFPDIAVVGEAGRSADALVLCERLQPDLILLDGALPGCLSLIAQLRESHREIGVVILVDRVDEALLRRALQHNVVGYLLKQIDVFDLIQAVRSAAGGLLTLAPEAATVALARSGQPECEQDALSEREQAVLALLLHGISNDDIAARLRVSCSTVKFHLRNIYSKLGVRSRAEALAVVYGQRRIAPARSGEALPERPLRRPLAVAV